MLHHSKNSEADAGKDLIKHPIFSARPIKHVSLPTSELFSWSMLAALEAVCDREQMEVIGAHRER